jgi:putative MATE family efflux protein
LGNDDRTVAGSTSSRVWELAWPSILSNLLFTTVGFLHIKIVAGLGTSAVAAVTTGHRVFFLVQAIMMGLSVAATAIIARHWGAGDVTGAERVTWNTLGFSVALGALLSLPVLIAPFGIAGLFGLDEQTTSSAAGFIFWLGVFNVFTAVNMILGTALRAIGDVITPLWYLFFSSVLNIGCAYCLAFGLGPLPALGVAGIAAGGSFGALLVTSVFVFRWWRGAYGLRARKEAAVDWSTARQLVKIGSPAVLEQGAVQLAFLVFFSIVATYGTSAYAAYGIGISIVSFSIVVGFGFGIAAATIVGQQLGAGRPQLAIQAGWRSLRMAVVSMALLSVILAVFAEDLARFMIADDDVVHLTKVFIYFIALLQPIMACELTLAGALRGAGDTRFPLMATMCGIFLGRLIPAWIATRLGLSVYWIFAVMILDYGIKACLLTLRFRSEKWLDIRLSAAGISGDTLTLDSDKKNT